MAADGEVVTSGENKSRKDEAGKPNVKFWVSQLQAAKKMAKNPNSLTAEAWDEFMYGMKLAKEGKSSNETRDPIYWASVRTIQPALYSRTPIPEIEKTFDDLPDPIAGQASMALERLAKYLMRKTPFDRVMYATRDTFIHGGKTTTRVYFEGQVDETAERSYYSPEESAGPDGAPVTRYMSESGEPAPDGSELTEDEEQPGRFYSEQVKAEIKKAECCLIPVHYRDILHTPNARQHDEITWIAFKNQMLRDECRERFKDTYKFIKFTKSDKDKELSGDEGSDDLPEESATIWEIWNKRDMNVIWLDDLNSDQVLDYKKDPYELEGFFPCPPFMLGTTCPDDLYALPDYIQLKPCINQMHGIAKRLQKLVRATRRKGLYDNTVKELADLASDTDEAEYIGVANFQQNIVGKGGIDNVVMHFPVGEFVAAIQELVNAQQVYEQRFNQTYGIPDILRGVSDPNETFGAQQLKGRYLSVRFSWIQREFQRLCRDSLELMCDLALKKMPGDKLRKIMGIPAGPQGDQVWAAIAPVLMDDKERSLRIQIETDSTITMNENAEIEQRNYLLKVLFEGIQSVGTTSETAPEMKPVVAQGLLYAVNGIRNGQQLTGALEQAIQAMEQQAQQPPPGEAQDPSAMADVQLRAQIAQQELQFKGAKLQADTQLAQQKLQLGSMELQLKGRQMQVELQKILAATQNEEQRIALDSYIAQLDAQMKTAAHELETVRVQLDMDERYMTEERLQKQEEREDIVTAADFALRHKEINQRKEQSNV